MSMLDRIRNEIDHLRVQVGRHRREVSRLRHSGIDVGATEALIGKIQAKIQELCSERDALRKMQPSPTKGRVGRRKW